MQRRFFPQLASKISGCKSPLGLITQLAIALVMASSLNAQEPVQYTAPAGTLPATQHVTIDGVDAAVLPNGRIVTPAGIEDSIGAPKPFGLAISPDGNYAATVNSGIFPFSATLLSGINHSHPTTTVINLYSTFMGIAFSADSQRFYISGGQIGNIWVGDTATAAIIGSVNLNGAAYPYGALNPSSGPANQFNGSFPGAMVVSHDGHYLYVVDQSGFEIHVIDTTHIATGLDSTGNLVDPDNFAAVVATHKVGRYPFGIALSADDKTLYVANVGVFQYTSLDPSGPVGNNNIDFPLCYPATSYPDHMENDTELQITKVDPRNLPATLRDPNGIRCGYVAENLTYVVPGLGSPNVPESSSVYILDVTTPTSPETVEITKTGLKVGEIESGIETYSGSHPNSVAVGKKLAYVTNGNNDTVSVIDRKTNDEVGRIRLAFLRGHDEKLKGLQPVSVALSPDEHHLYVAEAGINALAVVCLETCKADAHHSKWGSLEGLIPTGWWPSAVKASADGSRLYVANANGRGALPNDLNPPDNLGSPKSSTYGSVSVIPVPDTKQLMKYTQRVLVNNGLIPSDVSTAPSPIPREFGHASSQIKHVIFINKENATYDLLLGDILKTRKGVPVNGEPSFSLGQIATPNHHELALQFAFSDNFYLEPSVSSDGHRWLTNTYTTEFEQTHWPASYGGRRSDSGDNAAIYVPYPGRLGFTDANSSPEPHDYNQHGGIAEHLLRNRKTFANFGNGFEFAIVDEDGGTDPTGIRNHVNVPMEDAWRENSDHLYPEFNTHIPDSPLPEDPTRFSRFGRFQQVFDTYYADRKTDTCKLPNYVDLYFPNDHTGGAFDINPNGPAWSPIRFIQDNDAALGHTVDLISHSPCWKDTVIFVVEDDTQNGMDHVNGARSIFLAISPWVKHEYLGKQHFSLSSVFKTVDLILGVPALNQYDLVAGDLREMFTTVPDFTSYNLTNISYDGQQNASWIKSSSTLDFSKPDANEEALNRALLRATGLPRRKPGKK